MKSLAITLFATICLAATPILAQASTSDATGSGSSSKNPQAEKMKELVQGCRKAAHDSGLTPKSPEMRKSVIDCVAKERPGMANVLRCRFEGMDKGLKPGDDLKAFVKDCMKKSG